MTNNRFTDFIGSDLAKLDDGIFIYWWHTGISHEEMMRKYSNGKDFECFASSDVNGNVDLYDIERLSKYSKYKNLLKIKMVKFYRG